MKYSWGHPRFERKGDPEKIGKYLMKMYKDNGQINPEMVLEDARHKDSPLRPFFEWDNYAAANKHRRTTATNILGALRVIPDEVKVRTPMKAFYRIKKERGRWVPISEIIVTDKLREALTEQAEAMLERFRARFAHLTEFSDVLKAINRTLSRGKVRQFRRKAS